MSEQVKLYYQCNNKFPIWDFCYHAALGAMENGIPHIPFEDVDKVPLSPYHIIVGSVEESIGYLNRLGLDIPEPIQYDEIHPSYYGRDIDVLDMTDLKDGVRYPIFVKPNERIKAFTGFVAKNHDDVQLFCEGYQGLVQVHEVINIISEWRAYVRNDKFLGMYHYLGDTLEYPSKHFVQEVIGTQKIKDRVSYAIDFGLTDDGRTIVVEANDGWAIANYGLSANDYYYFIRDRWFQLTGLRK